MYLIPDTANIIEWEEQDTIEHEPSESNKEGERR